MALLDEINSPADLTKLSGEQLLGLAEEIRAFLIEEQKIVKAVKG